MSRSVVRQAVIPGAAITRQRGPIAEIGRKRMIRLTRPPIGRRSTNTLSPFVTVSKGNFISRDKRPVVGSKRLPASIASAAAPALSDPYRHRATRVYSCRALRSDAPSTSKARCFIKPSFAAPSPLKRNQTPATSNSAGPVSGDLAGPRTDGRADFRPVAAANGVTAHTARVATPHFPLPMADTT
ncbi:unnamed protein product, partial [Iphiclides podalirius]